MSYIEKEPIIDFITKGLNNPDKTKAFGHDAIEILTEIEFAQTIDVIPEREWISVEERLPEDGETVLTISSELEMEVYDYDSEWEGIFQKFNGSIKVFNITHWMPLPEAPKIEGGSNDT